MKDFQFVIQNFLKNHEKHKKYIALLTVLSLLVSFAVPFSLIMPAVSMTGELICGMEEHIHSDECYEISCGIEESDEHLHNADCYTLVCDIPEHIHSQECYSDYEEENYEEDLSQFDPDNNYLINLVNATSISSLNNDNETDDVTLLAGNKPKDPKGNLYGNFSSIDDVIRQYQNDYILGIASQFSVFVNGNFIPYDSDTEGRMAVGGSFESKTGWGEYTIGKGDFQETKDLSLLLDNDKYATIIWGAKGDNPIFKGVKMNESKYSGGTMDSLVAFEPNGLSYVESQYSSYKSRFYNQKLIDFDTIMSDLNSKSEKLANKGNQFDISYDENTRTITFHYNGNKDTPAEVVYATLNDEQAKQFSQADNIVYENIPNLPESRKVIKSTADNYVDWNYSYIIVNMPQTNNTDDNNGLHLGRFGKSDIDTSINKTTKINNVYINGNKSKDSENGGIDESGYGNNAPGVTSLLYNIPNATQVVIPGSFQGTIFAPNADVTDEKKLNNNQGRNAHLSGALIAKSFEGYTEFGYRPFTGPISLLGSSMGYTIPVDKVVTGATNQWLAGAKFEIIDSENNVVNSFTSGEGTNFVDIPSKVDFTGGTDYRTSAKNLTGTYTIKEVSAPEGYIADTAKTYTVKITEEVQSEGLIETDSGTIPTYIKATVQFDNHSPFTIELKDIYSYDGSSSKQIRRELKIGSETFYLEIDNGQVSEVSKKDGNPTGTGTVIVTDNKQNEIDVLTSEISHVTVFAKDENDNDILDENNAKIPVTETSQITIFNEIEGLTPYNINIVHLEADVTGGYDITFYYNGSAPQTYHGNSSSNYNLDLGSLNKENVVGISIKFDNDVNGKFFIQETSNGYATIFGTDYNTYPTFNAGQTYYYYSGTNPAETTTSISEITQIVTSETVVSSYSTLYYTTTSISYYNKYATIIADPSTAQIYPTTTVDSKYYYNPDDIMMMPMPSENLTFENRCGLLFKKVDSNGNPLSGATIKLQQKNGDNYADVADTVWNWTGSSFTIDPLKLGENVVYKFVETAPPTGYETAPDIYFKKTDTNKIVWGTAEDSLTNNLDLTNDNNRTITMTDTKITGAKVKLKKTKDDGTTLLNGAKFKLYSADDETTPIYPTSDDGFIVENGEIDLYETFKNDSSNTNPDYIQNGYLKEGLYYLDEVSAPTGYQSGQKFYFTINKNNGVYDVETGLPQYIVAYQGALQKDSSVNQYNDSNTYTNVTAIEVLFTFTGDDINKAINDSDINIQGNKNWINGIGEWSSLFKNSSLGSYTLNNSGNEYVIKYTFNSPVTMDGSKDIQYQSNKSTVTIKEVRVYGDSSSGGSSGGGSSTTDFGEGITVSNKEITLNSTGLSRTVTDDMITNDSVVMTLTFNTPSGEFGYGNGKYKAVIDNEYKETNAFSFQETAVIRSLKVSDICALFGISNSDFRKISEFKIDCWNTTTISDVSFTNITASTDPDTPTGGEGENNSNNTEEGAIDKDTTVTEVGYVGLIAKNSPMGDKTSITVKKNWVDDTDYKTLRPASIQVQLYRSTDPNLSTDNLTDDMKSGDSVTIQDTNGKWEHTWTNLDTKDESNNNYYYYVKEVDLNNYTVSYENNGISSGDIKIKNTLKTVDISVNKEWVIPEGVTGVTKPSVKVKLQQSSDGTDNSWTDTGKTLTLNSSNDWKGTFGKLPAGKYYKVVETNIPNGWTVSYSDENGQKAKNTMSITVTNTFKTMNLTVKKIWSDGNDKHTGDTISVKVYRSTDANANEDIVTTTTTTTTTTIPIQETTTVTTDSEGNIDFGMPIGEKVVLDLSVNNPNITYANGCLGMSVNYNEINYWANFMWEYRSSSGTTTIELPLDVAHLDGNKILNTGNGTDVKDSAILSAVVEKVQNQQYALFQVWWANDSSENQINNPDIKLLSAYIPVNSSQYASINILKNSEPSPQSETGNSGWISDGDNKEYKQITITATDKWQKFLENLAVYDSQGNPYYYWAVEETVSGYDVSYLFEDSDDTTNYCINASKPGAGEIIITNTKIESEDTEMPSTGGTGTEPYKVIGMVMTGGALIMLGIRRRKKHC